MNDTDAKTAAKFTEMIMQKSPQERFRMGCSMFDFSKELVKASILKENPQISSSFLRGELFLRFYGQDFDEDQKRKIFNHFSKS